jgi:hypothetical protein
MRLGVRQGKVFNEKCLTVLDVLFCFVADDFQTLPDWRDGEFNSILASRFVFFDYLISLSARASTLGGIVRPICLAVFRLITNSNFVGRSTGKSPGLAPFRILST